MKATSQNPLIGNTRAILLILKNWKEHHRQLFHLGMKDKSSVYICAWISEYFNEGGKGNAWTLRGDNWLLDKVHQEKKKGSKRRYSRFQQNHLILFCLCSMFIVVTVFLMAKLKWLHHWIAFHSPPPSCNKASKKNPPCKPTFLLCGN